MPSSVEFRLAWLEEAGGCAIDGIDGCPLELTASFCSGRSDSLVHYLLSCLFWIWFLWLRISSSSALLILTVI